MNLPVVADDILHGKRILFGDGDPDRDEFSDFSDYTILQLPDKSPEGGVARILCSSLTRQCRLLMRNATCSSILLNHFLLPGLTLCVLGNSVNYTTEDYSAGHSRLLRVQLTFESVVVREYFRSKFEVAVRINRLLLSRRISFVTLQDRFPPPRSQRQFDPGDPTSGIISHLARECGGNPHECGVLSVTASSVFQDPDRPGFWVPWRILGSAWRGEFGSANGPNQWFCLDFKDKRVALSAYALARSKQTICHLRNWAVEGSLDGAKWTELDRREREHVETSDWTRWEVARTEEVRFVRIRQTGPNAFNGPMGSLRLVFGGFEVFGTLFT
jgi:hypothetical protein